ncbi:TetR/AcrR family transcriptional regulator [Streptomyces coffeae]|uniref:TetR/AcrR family transcriptional regulator C-terminal domain-containing protein n=1 Tax=Streptomyces coffeae TaxID=621382 RepID=A0ABS1N8I0_9ACTN|nr:TetR/AcrR family transcriptional regulator [Streptomyces coffeae]MBL1096377.1 TetR/AcrR family transcriptional regulator C-terminal domain-containing protein [Streptomyces coffeae]
MANGSRAIRPQSSVWLSERKPPRRKADQQPVGLDRLKIVAATIRLLDAEGLAGFSMRRLAAELGVTAMSVYWYVDTKDHLLELALDAAMGEIVLPIEAVAPAKARVVSPPASQPASQRAARPAEAHAHLPAEPRDWRDQLRQLAEESRKVLVRHPWLSPLMGDYLNIGPNAMVFTNAAQEVMRNSGLPVEKLSSALALVTHFVFGFSTLEGRFAVSCREEGIAQDELLQEVMTTVKDRPDFDGTREMFAAQGEISVEEMRDRDFTFALDITIAGIEALRDAAPRDAASQDPPERA